MKEVEEEVQKLKQRVVPVVLTKKVLENAKTSHRPFKIQRPQPLLSRFFVGQSSELQKLHDIVREYGSSVISQFGGAGKTQPLVAFAEKLEADGFVPGGSFWVVADGKGAQIAQSLSSFVEQLL